MEAVERIDRRLAHRLDLPVVVVEDHRVDEVDPDAVRECVLQDGEAVRLEARPRRRQRVRDLDAGHALVEERDRLVATVNAVRLRERSTLDVHVDAADAIGVDELFVGRLDRAHGLARVADFRAALVRAPAAERRDDISAERSKRPDVGDVLAAGHRLAGDAVPGERARGLARRLEERQREVLHRGRLRGGEIGREDVGGQGRRGSCASRADDAGHDECGRAEGCGTPPNGSHPITSR